jgi:hypothetical protein
MLHCVPFFSLHSLAARDALNDSAPSSFFLDPEITDLFRMAGGVSVCPYGEA